MFNVDIGTPGRVFRATATNAASGTSAASISAGYTASAAGYRLAITHFSGASSVSGSYTIESPAGTVLWQKVLSGANHEFSEAFDPPLVVTASTVSAQSVVFKAGSYAVTNTGGVNGAGYEIYNTA